ncbi:MAG: chemotaxis protein CheX [Acidobacteriia bacterium]|nr:chemotaxis protein CheX [Terriglobia bacterium]
MLTLAAQEVFAMMLGATLESCPADEEVVPQYTSMVGLAGALCGLMRIQCTAASAHKIASSMLGGDPGAVPDALLDAMGEVCNMVAGNFKSKLLGVTDSCMLSVPTVITGADYDLHPVGNGLRCQVQLRYEGAPLAITLDVHE